MAFYERLYVFSLLIMLCILSKNITIIVIIFIICTFRDFFRYKFHFYIVYQQKKLAQQGFVSLISRPYFIFSCTLSQSFLYSPNRTLRKPETSAPEATTPHHNTLSLSVFAPFSIFCENTLRLRTKTTIFEMSLCA